MNSAIREITGGAAGLVRGLLPAGPARPLAVSTLAGAVAVGAFTAAGPIALLRSGRLDAAGLGAGLAAAGLAGLAGSAVAGPLADRVGARRVLVVLSAVQALAMAGYLAVPGPAGFAVVACCAGLADRGAGVARSTVIATLVDDGDRVRVKASLRSLFNLGGAAGVAAAALPLHLDARAGYVGLFAACTAALAVAAVASLRLPADPTRSERLPRPGRPARPGYPARLRQLADPGRLRYLGVALQCGLVATHHSLLAVALPVWATRTSAPRALVAPLLLLNTGLVIALQVRMSRGSDSVPGAAAAAGRGALAVALACPLLAVTASASPAVAAAGLVAGTVLLTMGELWCAAGAWGLGFGLAGTASPGSYQSLFALGTSVESFLGPLLATGVVLGLGAAGWLWAAAGFAVLATTFVPVHRWAARRAPAGAAPAATPTTPPRPVPAGPVPARPVPAGPVLAGAVPTLTEETR